MSAFLTLPARPVVFASDSIALRAQPSNTYVRGTQVIFTQSALRNVMAFWDETSTDVDDGTATPAAWKPDDIAALDPGRFVVFGGEGSLAHTYVKRDASGNISGITVSGDISAKVVHVNWDTGANDPVPSDPTGISIRRGAIASVERDRPGLWFDEGKPDQWLVAYDNNGDDVPVDAMYVRAAGLRSATASSGSDFLQSASGQGWLATLGGTDYYLVRGLASPAAVFGDETVTNTQLQGDSVVTMRARTGAVRVNANTAFEVRDAGNVTTYFQVDVTNLANASNLKTTVAIGSVTTSNVDGLTITPSDEASAGTPVRISPDLLIKSKVRVGITNRTTAWRVYSLPTTGGVMDLIISNELTSGGGFTERMRITTQSPSQAKSGVLATRIGLQTTAGELFFEQDNSSLGLGSSGELLMIARSASQPFIFRSSTTTDGVPAFRLWASGEAKPSTEKIVSVGSGTSPTYTEAAAWMGDGVIEHPFLHVENTLAAPTIHTGNFTAAVWTVHFLDLSTNPITATIPAAAAANFGHLILFVQVVAGTQNLTLQPSSGNIEGGASIVYAGLGSGALRSVLIKSLGAGTGSPGWKVVSLV